MPFLKKATNGMTPVPSGGGGGSNGSTYMLVVVVVKVFPLTVEACPLRKGCDDGDDGDPKGMPPAAIWATLCVGEDGNDVDDEDGGGGSGGSGSPAPPFPAVVIKDGR